MKSHAIAAGYKNKLRKEVITREECEVVPSIGDALCHDRCRTSVCSLLEILLDQSCSQSGDRCQLQRCPVC